MASPRLTEPLLHRQGTRLPSNVTEGEVREQLDRLLASAVFRNSKRNSNLLRHVVEQTLEGHQDDLKERAIGIDVFGRTIDYDTNADHVVRSVAGEVRRRLAQYYMEPDHENELRVDLLAGSYVPQFRTPTGRSVAQAAVAIVELPPPAVEIPVPIEEKPALWWQSKVAIGSIALALVAVSLTAMWIATSPTPFQKFWGPVFAASSPALLCVGGGAQTPAVDGAPPLSVRDFERQAFRHMHTADAMAMAQVAGALQSNGKPYRILNRASATSFKDLQAGPFILIGAMNNEWTLRLTDGLRFSFARQTNGARIADRQNPANTGWSVDSTTPINQFNRDYAIISRIRDPKTEQTAVVVAGIGSWGTQAAGEFVSNPEHLKKLEALAPSHWEKKNMQVVVATDVIAGSSGPPIVLATYFW